MTAPAEAIVKEAPPNSIVLVLSAESGDVIKYWYIKKSATIPETAISSVARGKVLHKLAQYKRHCRHM